MTDSQNKFIEIKRWDNEEVIHSGEYESIADCFNAAAKEGKSFFRANLSSADLTHANLRFADLISADLTHANLSYANLRFADLISANLTHANLRFADLISANLTHANLSYANLVSANLISADLTHANLSYADLISADLRFANLISADLTHAKNTAEIKFFNNVIGDGVAINSMQFGEYKIAIIGDFCCAGCTTKTCQEWLDFDGSELSEGDKKYLEGVTKPYIRMILAMRESEF